jgi:endo-1,4-beta-xylanase
MISRRAVLAGAVGAGALSSAGVAASAEPSLASAAEAAGLLYGASIGQEAFSNPAYADLYRRETKIVTTDVALKFDWLRPSQDRFEFGPADAILEAAAANGKLVRGHTLIWNDNAPAWLKRLSAREIERVFDEHIDKVASRYAGRLHSWDVVNEPFWPMDGKPGGWRDGPWFAAMGPSYVERAFRRVAAIDKTAKLTLNEAQCDNDRDWGRSIRPLLRGLVDQLMDKGVPLHAIGLQSHLQPQWPSNYAEFADYAGSFGANGLAVYLTEFDVNDEAFADDPVARDAAVARTCDAFLKAALAVPAVSMIVNWQLSDRYSWYRDVWRRERPRSNRFPRPLPFDESMNPKPMRQAMLAAFSDRARGLPAPKPKP